MNLLGGAARMRALMFRISRLALTATLIGIVTIGFASAEQLTGTAIVSTLRQGGYVILMRHASSPREIPARAFANADNLTPERQLDENGRATARAMGDAIKTLRIPIGDVLSSPTYRAQETIKLAGLPAFKTAPQLGEGASGSNMAGPGSPQSGAWLRAKASEKPRNRDQHDYRHPFPQHRCSLRPRSEKPC